MSEGCHYCGTTEKELRPYGPGGSNVCFPCATATPEREASAKSAFGALLDGVGAVTSVVAIGQPSGPTSVEHAIRQASPTGGAS